MKGVILHGGQGTRLRPLTHTGPKQLIPIANKPISQYVLESLKDAGINDVAIVLGAIYPEKVKEYYGDGGKFGVRIRYIHQAKPSGIAHAVKLCKDFVGDDAFVVHLGDDLIKGGIKRYVQEFQDATSDGMVLLCKVKDPQRFGVAAFDTEGRLVALIEKPKIPPSEYALSGVYFFRPSIFQAIRQLKPSKRGELEITEAIQRLIEHGKCVDYRIVKGWWKDTGTPDNVLDSNRLILDELQNEIRGKVESTKSIQGRVYIGKGTVVERGAIVRGPASIGEDSFIAANVYIGPYTSIGHNVMIRKGEIEDSIIMNHCIIEIDERITNSLIGPHSVIITNQTNKPRGYRFVIGEHSRIMK